MKTNSIKKFSSLFKEEDGGSPAPSNVSSDVATSGLQGDKTLKKRKELEESEPK